MREMIEKKFSRRKEKIRAEYKERLDRIFESSINVFNFDKNNEKFKKVENDLMAELDKDIEFIEYEKNLEFAKLEKEEERDKQNSKVYRIGFWTLIFTVLTFVITIANLFIPS